MVNALDDMSTNRILNDNEAEHNKEIVTTLESTIETLSNQLGSLVDSGEVFEKNAHDRDVSFVAQIQKLRKGRKKDRQVYKTAVEASNAWRTRAEYAENMLVEHKLGTKGVPKRKKGVRPTPPTNNEYHSEANQMNVKRRQNRQNRKFVNNNSLPPVSSATPSPLKAAPA